MKVILYDGECGFCAASIRFVWKRDRFGVFYFASLQSEKGKQMSKEHGRDPDCYDSMVLIDGKVSYDRSEAALRIARELPRYRLLARLGGIVPRPMRDFVYNAIAQRRHRLGGSTSCELPPPEVQERFLDH